jgi:hypothetical protein
LNLLYLFVLPVGELAKVQGSVLDVNAVYSDPKPSGSGILVIAPGIPLYFIFGRRRLAQRQTTK